MKTAVPLAVRPGQLFLISILALFTAGVSYSLRAGIAVDLQSLYFDHIDPLHATAMTGQILGAAFIGFAITLFTASPMLDAIGMKRTFWLAILFMSLGTLIVISADLWSAGNNLYWALWSGMLIIGIGWGCVEATINPLITSLFHQDKTPKMNALHAWWPGGLVVGGLVGILVGALAAHWKMRMGVVFLPLAAMAVLLWGANFPLTERAAAGIPWSDMMKEIYRAPGFLIWIFIIFLAAGSEFAPGQFVDLILTTKVGMRGILLLVYVSGLMFTFRHFAGFLVARISPVALMWFSAILAALGLGALSLADSPVTALLAATLWGAGVCFLWPTILASVSERYPRGGSFFIGIMATAGALSSTVILPQMGAIFDSARISYAGGADKIASLSGPALIQVQDMAAADTFRAIMLLPGALIVIFAVIWLKDQKTARRERKILAENDPLKAL